MAAHLDVPKTRPEDVAARTLEAVEAGHDEVLVDARARELKAQLASDPTSVSASLQRAWDTRPRQR
jgi:hypothetical protein